MTLSLFQPGISSVNMSFSLRSILCVVVALAIVSDNQVNALDGLNGFCAPHEIENSPDVFKIPEALFGFLSGNPRNIHFLLYPDASDPNVSKEIVPFDKDSLVASGFDGSKPIKILVHGFYSNYASNFPADIKNAYLGVDRNNTYNVMVVDWGRLANPGAGIFCPTFYSTVVDNLEATGKRVGDFIIWLRDAAGLDLKDVHLVGHSLGAHVSGRAGMTVYKRTGKKVGRITALDPAGSLLGSQLVLERIRNTDAVFVDSYHTNARRLGRHSNAGHVDFYINGGTGQPGCGLDEGGNCSRSRSHQFFAQTVLEGSPNSPTERKMTCVCDALTYILKPKHCCNKKLVLGEYCPEGTTGEYFIRMRSKRVNDVVMPKYGNSLEL